MMLGEVLRLIYTILFYCALPLVFLRLWWRGRRYAPYRQRWLERLGFYTSPAVRDAIWIHAVSYGEAVAAEPLVRLLMEHYPNRSIVFTTMTPTGSERVQQSFGDAVHHVYMPYDLPDVIARFLSHANPSLAIFVEMELWPNVLHACQKKNIPVLLANARLSAKSFRGYHRIPNTIKKMLQAFTVIAAQTKTDAKRFLQLGAKPETVTVTGSIKFDLTVPQTQIDEGHMLRTSWETERTVFCAASTHEGEEEIILQAFKQIKEQQKNCLLMLVPRHPERFDDVAALCRDEKFNVVRRTDGASVSPSTDILLGDTMGELFLFYASSDIAFVGGSLMPIGGHNPLEALALGLPTLMGPHYFKSQDIVEMLKAQKILTIVNSEDELTTHVLSMLNDAEHYTSIKERCLTVMNNNKGALLRHLDGIRGCLGK